MRKRRQAAVVISSDEEETTPASASKRKRKCSTPNLKKRASADAEQDIHQNSVISDSRKPYSLNSITFPSVDFEVIFYGSNGSAGSEALSSKEGLYSELRTAESTLWVDKYRPNSIKELAVHKKKIEEVMSWLEERITTISDNSNGGVLLISGQAGTGKSTTVQLIASHCGVEVCEWHCPIPTIWQEHLHQANSGVRYISKLDEFINFVESARKFGVATSSFLKSAKASSILLLDDLPVTHGRQAFQRMKNSLLLLIKSTCIPTIILTTDHSKSDSSDNNARLLAELQTSLVNAGACKISFNPITSNAIKKVLTRIAREEHCDVGCDQINHLAKSSGGDIRHAITSLQVFCLKQNTHFNVNGLIDQFSSLLDRDEPLSLYHALGKFLYNKREAHHNENSEHSFVLREKLVRLPLKMDTPEKILTLAHGQAGQVTSFLHENVLDFMNDDAADDASIVAAYFSDSDLLLSSHQRSTEVENALQSVSASVAVRGVLFGNGNPSQYTWHSMRKPKIWEVERLIVNKRREMVNEKLDVRSNFDDLVISDDDDIEDC